MHQHELITARGTGLWGERRFDVELVTTVTTWTDTLGERRETLESYTVVVSDRIGPRPFGFDADARDRFLAESFAELDLEALEPPERRRPPQPFDGVLGAEVTSVEFMRDALELRFDSPPLALFVWPRIHTGDRVLRRADPGYADALIALIGRRLRATDELLDVGLVLDFDGGTRLTIPLDGSDAASPEVAEFRGEPGGLWVAGEEPFPGELTPPG